MQAEKKKVFVVHAFDGREAREAKRALAEQGHEVLNPERTSLRESVRLLCEADAVHIVHGYGSSDEASLLVEIASRLSLEDIGLNDERGQ
jgi:hypothetical protein